MDIAGAYPNLSRRQIRKALSIRLPEFVPIFDMLYQAPSEHTILTADEGTKHVTQHIGLTQGSELSPLFFMIATDQSFEGERNTYWLKHQIKYADDISLVGTVDEVISDYQKLKTAFTKMNLHFKQEKKKIFAPKPESINFIKLSTAFPQ